MRLLIVEDDAPLASGLQRILEAEGHAVDVTPRGEEAVLAASQEKFDLVILDIGLPQMDGFEVLRRLRAGTPGGGPMPVLVLTARDAVDDRVRGLDLGADDYMVKPFAMPELTARVRALLRRSHDWREPDAAAGLVLDEAKFEARWDGTTLDLTPVEFRLLKTLSAAPGRVFSRQQLLNTLYEDHRVVTDRTVDSHVKNLRRKLQQAHPGDELIESIYGVGYRFTL